MSTGEVAFSSERRQGPKVKIFVAGATGVVGRRMLEPLVGAGHALSAVARSPGKADLARRLGATPVAVDLFDPDAVRRGIEGHEVVINIATKIPPIARSGLPGAWRENSRIRSEGSRNLVDAALAAGAGRYVQESFAPTYPDRGDAWIDEDVPLEPAPYARTVLDAERETERFTEAGGVGIALRFGLFYGPDGIHAETILNGAKRGYAPVMGLPGAFISSNTTEDAASAVVAALDAPAGAYNVVDDEPLTRRNYADALAHAVGREHLRTVPTIRAKIGGSKTEMLMRS